MKAMIFAAGLGTRLKPWTDHHPKALAPVNGKSLLQRNIGYLQQHGIYDVIINVHHFASQIIDAVDGNSGWGSHITISDETDAVLETGGGLKKAAWYFSDEKNFAVMNADILTDMDLTGMIAAHERSGSMATLAVTERETSRYFLFDERNTLCGWENVKTGEQKIARPAEPLRRKAFSGMHIISSSLLPLLVQEGKFSMVDVYLSLAANHTISAYDHTGSHLIDVGKPESLAKAEAFFL
ncbi:nucleotidyltransferase family protein [Sediminibacterium soli]|uniref:nucleotidyltransferase family protein n=1 Tax=Sediminibacterium soli TaxID=2698829 RepID=UPI00137AC0D3|nr:sugar phosphate nucleotidyltransferase [Sediminibacterium soli]NCI45387.1 NTP transferase domain-containing protein [Sediminibacterium soli]